MKIKITYLILLLSHFVYSQNLKNEVDLLVEKIKNSKEDTNKVKLLFRISEICEIEDVFKYAEASYNLAAKLDFKKGVADAQNNMAYIYANEGNPSKALELYKNSLSIQELIKNPIGIAQSLNNVGDVYESQGEVAKALEYYLKALKIQEKINDSKNTPTTLDHLGSIYHDQGNFNTAMEYYKKGLFINEKYNNLQGIALSYNNIGIIYLEQKNYSKALHCHQKSKKILEKLGDQLGIARSLNNIASIYKINGDKEKSLEYFLESLKITEKINFKQGNIITLNGISKYYFDKNEITKALEYGKKAHALSLESESPINIKITSENLYEIYNSLGKDKEALQMHVLFKNMSDKINNQETQKISLQMIFNKKEEQLLIDQGKKNIITQLEKKKQKLILLYVSIFLFSLVIFSVILFNRFKLNQRQRKIIEEKNHEILDSITYAKRIQYTLLANAQLLQQNIPQHFVLFNPKDIVSGDFYWATTHNNKFYLAVCDSTGHGVPGAFMSLLNMGFLSEAIKEKNIEKPNEILNYARMRLIQSIGNDGQQDGMDAILICLNTLESKVLTYAAANNEPILISNNQIIELAKDKMPVGKGEKEDSFTLQTIEVKKGDVLYLYTDGFADQFGGPKGKKFKYKQLNQLLLEINNSEPIQQLNILETTFKNWKGDLEQVDDVCIIGIKI